MRPNHWKAIFETRAKLFSYIDALWTGRLASSKALTTLYTERLAATAKFAALLRYVRSTDEIRRLVREENGQFSRELLATDEGRRARSAFNLFARDATALEDYRRPDGSVPTGPEGLIDEQLWSVTFRPEEIILDFNGQRLAADCAVLVASAEQSYRRGDNGFADQICSAIGGNVQSVEIGNAIVTIALDRLRLEFTGYSGKGMLVFTSQDGEEYTFD